MAQDLTLKNSQIIFVYSRNLDIRKKVFQFEDLLKDHFTTPFRTVAIPDEMDPNIPRFESQSIHGFSRLQVSQNRITIATNFDDRLDNNGVQNYLSKKRELLTEIAQSEKIQFFAYVIELQKYFKYDEINSVLKKNTGVKALTKDCGDFSLLYSKTLKDMFYLNIKCSKFTEQKMILDKKNNLFKPTSDVNHGISVTVDINTKKYFENRNEFKNSLYKLTEKEVFQLINNKKLEDYLNGNV